MNCCNHKIDCSVENCCYNENGMQCNKECISVCNCEGGTCCASYKDRNTCRQTPLVDRQLNRACFYLAALNKVVKLNKKYHKKEAQEKPCASFGLYLL